MLNLISRPVGLKQIAILIEGQSIGSIQVICQIFGNIFNTISLSVYSVTISDVEKSLLVHCQSIAETIAEKNMFIHSILKRQRHHPLKVAITGNQTFSRFIEKDIRRIF